MHLQVFVSHSPLFQMTSLVNTMIMGVCFKSEQHKLRALNSFLGYHAVNPGRSSSVSWRDVVPPDSV